MTHRLRAAALFLLLTLALPAATWALPTVFVEPVSLYNTPDLDSLAQGLRQLIARFPECYCVAGIQTNSVFLFLVFVIVAPGFCVGAAITLILRWNIQLFQFCHLFFQNLPKGEGQITDNPDAVLSSAIWIGIIGFHLVPVRPVYTGNVPAV